MADPLRVRLSGSAYAGQPPERVITALAIRELGYEPHRNNDGTLVIKTFALDGAGFVVELSDAGWYRVVGYADEPWREMYVEAVTPSDVSPTPSPDTEVGDE